MTSAERSWRLGLLVLAATLVWIGGWYWARVRGQTEMALGFGLIIGAATALAGFGIAAVFIRDAAVSGMSWTSVRIAVAGFVGLAILASAAIFLLCF